MIQAGKAHTIAKELHQVQEMANAHLRHAARVGGFSGEVPLTPGDVEEYAVDLTLALSAAQMLVSGLKIALSLVRLEQQPHPVVEQQAGVLAGRLAAARAEDDEGYCQFCGADTHGLFGAAQSHAENCLWLLAKNRARP